jgi:hypothetical protein
MPANTDEDDVFCDACGALTPAEEIRTCPDCGALCCAICIPDHGGPCPECESESEEV